MLVITNLLESVKNMEEKIKIKKGSVQETLIIPLYGRKLCTERFSSLYEDKISVDVINKLDYDFSDLNKKAKSAFYEFGALEGAMRQLDMVWEINDYLKQFPKASIVVFGCGLDVDPRRCGNNENKIYNLDFKEVIDAREELIGIDPRETNIAGDINDLTWIDKIDYSNGVILYAAGVFHYFAKENVKKITLAIKEKMPNARLVFDCINKRGYKAMMKTVLKSFKMEDVDSYFFSNKPQEEFSKWYSTIKVSQKGYMLGYYDMKNKEIKGIHRFLAKLGDKMMGMKIIRIDF